MSALQGGTDEDEDEDFYDVEDESRVGPIPVFYFSVRVLYWYKD